MNLRGFSYLELLIYLALFALLLVGALSGAAALSSSAQRVQAHARMEEDGTFVLQRIRWDIAHARRITAESDILTIEGDGISSRYFEADGRLKSEHDGYAYALTDSSISASEFSIVLPGTPESATDPRYVSVSFRLTAPVSGDPGIKDPFAETFYLTP